MVSGVTPNRANSMTKGKEASVYDVLKAGQVVSCQTLGKTEGAVIILYSLV